jgi:hypothetical protein
MRLRKEKVLLDVLLGTGLYLLDSVRDRVTGRVEDLTDKARDTYETASDRVARAGRAIRGEDSHVMGTVSALLIGVGIGVGVGMLLAPASGGEIRSNIAEKVRNKFAREPQAATGTYGE